MTSTYLNQSLIPLVMALPRMLEKVETALADETVEAAEKRRLEQRADLIRALLARSRRRRD